MIIYTWECYNATAAATASTTKVEQQHTFTDVVAPTFFVLHNIMKKLVLH